MRMCTPRWGPAWLLLLGVAACSSTTTTTPPAVTCGQGETLMNNVCIVNPTPQPTPTLQPGQFESPWVRLQRIEGTVFHLHTDEVRYRDTDKLLFQCSYTFGVLDVHDPANISYFADNIKHKIGNDPRAPGCIHLGWDGNIVFTTHRGNESNPPFLSGWDISTRDPADPNHTKWKPTQIAYIQEPNTSYEGIDVANGHLYVALHEKGFGIYQYDHAANKFTRTATLTGFTNAWGVAARDTKVYVADSEGGLAIIDVTDPTHPTLLGQVGIRGESRGVDVNGNIAYVAAGSGGLVTVDVSDPAHPKILGQADTRGSAIRVSYASGFAYVAAWDDTRAYDVSDPTKPTFQGAVRLTQQSQFGPTAGDLDLGRPPVTVRTLGVAAHDNIVFIGNWWVLYAYKFVPGRVAPEIVIREEDNELDFATVPPASNKAIPLRVYNQGTAPLRLVANYTEGNGFSVNPAQVEIAPLKTATLAVNYYASTPTKAVSSTLHILSDDPDQSMRTVSLHANRPGPAIGRPMPDTKVNLLDGSEFQTSQLKGKVLAIAYFATF